VTVFAAASLNQAFVALGKEFETRHPDARVRFSFAGSQSLVAQIKQGAPADVLATADVATIDSVKDELAAKRVVFAHNQLAIITARGNPLGIRSLRDLGRPGLKVVLAAPSVPVGKASARALADASVAVRPVSLEDAVTGVVGKVRLGEADAGIAYATDLPGLSGVPLPGTRTELAIGAVKLSAGSLAFIAFVVSDRGQAVLRRFGFT
jgi:molybdate transport system substrate-binding protein